MGYATGSELAPMSLFSRRGEVGLGGDMFVSAGVVLMTMGDVCRDIIDSGARKPPRRSLGAAACTLSSLVSAWCIP